MEDKSISRRNFLALSAGVTGHLYTQRGIPGQASFIEAALDDPRRSSRNSATDREIVEDVLASLSTPNGLQKRSASHLLPGLLQTPFSFTYGQEPSSDLLKKWVCEPGKSVKNDTSTSKEVTYREKESGVSVRIVATTFEGFPVIAWTMHLKNDGHQDSQIFENIQALDLTLACQAASTPSVHHAKGATATQNDFMPLVRELRASENFSVEPGGGRSSSEFLPYFNVEMESAGVIAACGWTGEWKTSFRRETDSEIRVATGMVSTHLKLHPGEEIRTPLVSLLFWSGDRMDGQNEFRQFILSHHRPKSNGEPVRVPMCNGNWGGTPASTHFKNIDAILARDLPMDYYWIDAEWFGNGPWWKNVGDWKINRSLYPDGMRPISDRLHAGGRKFLLWFEPFRVAKGTPWYAEHDKWLLAVPESKRISGISSRSDPNWEIAESRHNVFGPEDKLWNLAIPEARNFVTDFISERIERDGIDCYRQDFNFAPEEFWRAADDPDRQGITQIKWVEGLYWFWDELLRRHPNLLIDICASGGRHLDLEALGRGLPLWRTDYAGHPTASQCHAYGLMLWLPLHSTTIGNLATTTDYDVRSGMSSGLQYGLLSVGDAPQKVTDYSTYPFDRSRKMLQQQREIERYLYGDYYPLTEYTQSDNAWMAYQLHLRETNEGIVVVFRRPQSTVGEMNLRLKGMQGSSTYELTNLDTDERVKMRSGELSAAGFKVSIETAPAAKIFSYKPRSS